MLAYFFWGALFLVAYSYIVYPILLLIVSGVAQVKRDILYVLGLARPRIAENSEQQHLPQVAVIISAYNEADCIAERVRNLQRLDYPKDRIKYYIGSDGSVDETSSILAAIDDSNLVAVNFEENRGKASVLNDLVTMAEAEYLVFSDANTYFQPDAVLKLVRHFANESNIDAVCGELHLTDEASGKNQDGAYWKYERVLKFNESRIGALLGANGAIYALRKDSYKDIPASTIVDDFTIVFQVAVDGGQVLYEPEAVASEEVAPSTADEYQRRVRIGSGNYQAFSRFPEALNPRLGWLWFAYMSHKVLRWHTPHMLVVALLCSLLLALDSWFYLALFVAQSVIYCYCCLTDGQSQNKLLSLVVFWVQMNIALGRGAFLYYKGDATGRWHSTAR